MSSLEDGWACAQTVHRFFRCLDDGRPDEGAALFAENGVWTKRGAAIAGRAAILASMRERGESVATRHLVTNLTADAEGEAMVARYYVTTFADEAWSGGVSPMDHPAVILVCEDRLVETPEGWRFTARSSRVVFARR